MEQKELVNSLRVGDIFMFASSSSKYRVTKDVNNGVGDFVVTDNEGTSTGSSNTNYGFYGNYPIVIWSRKNSTYSSNNKNMKIVETLKLIGKGEPEKSNIIAGIRTANDGFTPEGKEIMLEWLYQQHKADIKKEISDPIIEEGKKKCS